MDSPSTPPSRRSRPHGGDAHSPLLPRSKSPFSSSPLRLPLHDLLLLSPSPLRKPNPDDAALLDPPPPSRRKTKTRAAPPAASPRNVRRARRRVDKDSARDDAAAAFEDDAPRPRKRRQSKSRPAHSDKPAASLPPSAPSPLVITDDDGTNSLDGVWEMISELVMWKNVAKSTLWFGFGSILFTSSWLSNDFSFSIISAAAHVGVFASALAFFYDSFPERPQKRWKRDFRLTEADVLRAARVVLPTANAVLAKGQEIFSGEPMMTLKVAPALLFAAKYGHLITLWRLLAAGFFMSFTIPKLYSCYYHQIHKGVENMRRHISEAWNSCGHKRIVAASAATAFWNLFSVKARIFAAFFVLVILRHHHQQRRVKEENVETERSQEEEQQQETERNQEEGQQQAMVLAE